MTTNKADRVPSLKDLTGKIVAAYVLNNPIPASDLPLLIAQVHSAVIRIASGSAAQNIRSGTDESEAEKPTTTQIRKSIRDDGIVSFIDGRAYKTLKRHLSSRGLDPRSYRDRYGLPADYPMVAPNYAAQRSALAKAIGLGSAGGQAAREMTRRMAS